jgi:hypothetical protein
MAVIRDGAPLKRNGFRSLGMMDQAFPARWAGLIFGLGEAGVCAGGAGALATAPQGSQGLGT